MRKLLTLTLFGLASCGGADTNTTDDTATGYQAALSADAAVQESGLIAALAGKLTAQDQTGAQAASDSASITTLFMPQGCATVTTSLNVNTYTFNKCTGPYGLLKLDGTITATFTPMTLSKFKVDLAATGFKISTVTVNVTASAVVTTGVTQDNATVTSSSSATNARGDTMTHSGNYTAGWNGTCLTLDGSFTTTVGTTAWTTQVSNFRQCTGMCPDAGGTVTLTGGTGNVMVTVHYTNGSSAEVTTTRVGGTRGMIVLSCGAA
jgi:hypothetical protein